VSMLEPVTAQDWDLWVSAGRTRNHLQDDPIMDWLELYGDAAGFTRDDQRPDWDPRTDLLTFLFEQGHRFEAEVMRLIGERLEVQQIARGPEDARDPAALSATLAAMRAGVPVIAQAAVRDPAHRAYGMPDLLVRSDLLNHLVPGTLTSEQAAAPAAALGGAPWHYRVVDVKYRALRLDPSGAVLARDVLPYAAQVWVYSQALGHLQGYTPSASYLLGRSSSPSPDRGGCLDRLGRIDHDTVVDRFTGQTLAERTVEALEWIRRVRADGAAWRVLPEPSVPELYPHMRADRDAPWRDAKHTIGKALDELTMLPGMSPVRRRAAHAQGIRRWTDERASASSLGVWEKAVAQCDGVLAANRSATPVLLPSCIVGDEGGWRTEAALELYVDFETVSTMGDDFSSMPVAGGQNLIFQVGMGRWDDGRWVFEQWTCDRLTMADEARMLDAFTSRVEELRRDRGLAWGQVRLVHWWEAEVVAYESGPDSAKARHAERTWPSLPWFDFLTRVVQPAPVTVTGAFEFGLKPLAKAMHAAGLIETTWDEGPGDGMGAMIGAYWCEREAARTGGSMQQLPLMAGIAKYNEVDCRAMGELVRWLRANR
jgi:hypothetical protein